MAKFVLEIESEDILMMMSDLTTSQLVEDIADVIDNYCKRKKLKLSINATIFEEEENPNIKPS